MTMPGAQMREAVAALLDAFTLAGFDQMLRFHLDRRREEISLGGNLRTVAFEVLDTADRQGWAPALVAGAREANPTNPQLSAVAERWRIGPVQPEQRDTLERLLADRPGYLDPSDWRRRLGALEGRVGRVEVGTAAGTCYGTALLVAPDLCLTNHHVLAPVIEARSKPSEVLVRFDHKKSADGTVLNPGTTVPLADGDWLVDASPPSPLDSRPDPGDALPAEDELDYALFRLATEAGHEPVAADRAAPDAPARGWITGSAAPADDDRAILLLLQHPSGGPLKLALGPVLGSNANRTRVRHGADTEPGSSGSPCFDLDLQLVALHHSGDPDYSPGHRPAWNEAIPLPAVRTLLDRRGHAGRLFPPAD
ncbi:effector-associated domain EAD1-containing protein [Streptomyces sp. NRRL B-24484]|uniref:effector-associated domain EAD1-containing protein n=1 Tax=Streptomyces sp. NRRL B-24484 TaxID=1463833 RepID=UPI0004C0F2E4|nr:effector-associated domain EAD1-containing protein [Streptomyces sp. NRRL B-24484]